MNSKPSVASFVTPADIFRCTRCGDCCKGYGGTYVTEKQMQAIAECINMDLDQFAVEKCRRSGDKYVLAQGESGYCVFWDKNCTIYPVRPDMCRKWPFIENVLRDIGNWSAMANSCPGIRTDITHTDILRCVKTALLNLGSKGLST